MHLDAEELAVRFARIAGPEDTSSVADILAFCTALVASTLRHRGLTQPEHIRRILGLLAKQVRDSLAKDTIH